MAEAERNELTFEVRGDAEGRRLDLILGDRLSLSRAAVKRLLDAGLVTVNGRAVRSGAKGNIVEAGDRIVVRHAELTEQITPQAELPLEVAAAGDGWIIVDKPAGWPVHPLRPGEAGTVLNAVAARHPQVQGVGEGGLRSGVVHRLDVDTSGALLVATTQRAWERLRAAFAEHRIRKTYLAIVSGQLSGEGREVEHLAVTRHRPAKVGVVASSHPDARRCSLAWRSLVVGLAASLVEVDLETGFLHQVRVMMAHRGRPLVGDAWYGGNGLAGTALRPMLHARSLQYDEIHAVCEPPEDFQNVAAALGLVIPSR